MAVPLAFEPSPGAVGVSLVSGMERFSKPPAVVRRAGLLRRLAVIQQTHVQGSADMYFDEALWRALAGYVQTKGDAAGARVTTERRASLSLDQFFLAWQAIAADEREAPPLLTARSDGRPVLCMVTEYWAHVGGPAPYHDSYTYALYSNQDLEKEVVTVLATAPGRERWTITPQIHLAKGRSASSLARRLTAWITRRAIED